ELKNPIDKYASQVISADGELLGRFAYRNDNRVYVNYNEISPELVYALIATEDARFMNHSGVDAQGLMRAIIKGWVFRQKTAGGGSTISQQLAKLLYSPRPGRKLERILQKPIEWVIAVKLERLYTKEEIINMYLNQFDYLYEAIGIKMASQVYFNTTPADLTLQESATLVGMFKNPAYFNPVQQPERTEGRRNTVLQQMAKYGYLSEADVDSVSKIPLKLNFKRIEQKEGSAPYFREYLRSQMTAFKPERKKYAQWQYEDFKRDSVAWETDPLYGWCNKNKKPNGENYNLYADGLKIYTIIDYRMQQYAEQSVREHLSKTVQPAFHKEKKGQPTAPYSRSFSTSQVEGFLTTAVKQTYRYQAMKKEGVAEEEIDKVFRTPVPMKLFSWNGVIDTVMSPRDSVRYHKSFLRASFMTMDPHNGYVKTYVGNVNYTTFKYDGVTKARRQVGSTMKPFVYSLALLEGISPCDRVLHQPQHVKGENGEIWSPKNASNDKLGELVTIQWGLQNSSNWITAYLMSRLSPHALVRLLHSFGLTGEIEPVLPLALGTPSISLEEMVGGYSAFVNGGVRSEPMYVTRIEDNYGNTAATFNPVMKEVLPEEVAYRMQSMLRSVVDGGTGSRMRRVYGITAPMGGKTGTAQNHADGWFMAFTPKLVGGVWVGAEDPTIRFDRMSDGQAAATALPVYGLFMKKVYADKTLKYSQTDDFNIPDGFSLCGNGGNTMDAPEQSQQGRIDELFE
ncbi:MAG: transglycosylase domain-containing protein, partial [Tannerellaceae bacterium]|nr:transglycosylase domain-containing protein [Tannerellaceae bacterium]